MVVISESNGSNMSNIMAKYKYLICFQFIFVWNIFCANYSVDAMMPRRLKSHYFIDDIEKPNTSEFLNCHFHLSSTDPICWYEAAKSYDLDFKLLRENWPNTSSNCCATWYWIDCLNQTIILDNEKVCQIKDWNDYFQVIFDRINRNCSKWTLDSAECNQSTRITITISALLFIALINIIYLI